MIGIQNQLLGEAKVYVENGVYFYLWMHKYFVHSHRESMSL